MNIVEPIRKKQDIVSLENFLKKRGLRDLLLFVLGTNSGLRISDILALNVGFPAVSDISSKSFNNGKISCIILYSFSLTGSKKSFAKSRN